MWRRLAAGVMVAVLGAAAPAPAHADRADDAKAHFEAGRRAYKAGDYARAILEFEAAQRILPSAGFSFNIALAHERRGEWARAAHHYREYLRLKPLADDRTAVAARVTELEALARQLERPGPTTQPSGRPPGGEGTPGGAPENRIVKRAAPRPSFARFGAVVRADVDGKMRGLVGVAGLFVELADRATVDLAALLGSSQGLYAGGTFAILRGTYRPRLTLGVPVFFEGGPRAGVQGGAGFELRLRGRVGLFLDLTVAYFFSAPATYERTVFVPSLGVTGRL